MVLVFGAILVPTGWLNAGSDPPARGGFAAQAALHFDEWDLDRNGALSFRELGAIVSDTRIQGEAACALAAIHRVQRGKDPEWHHAAFSRQDLTASADAMPSGRRPPFDRFYQQGLTHLRSTCRVLFAPGAPSLDGVHQGPLGDCYLISSVGSIVGRDPARVRAMVGQNPDGSFFVQFPAGPTVRVPSVSDAEILLGSTDGRQGIWLNVIEKAYGELVLARRGLDEPAIDALSGGSTTRTLGLLTGRPTFRLPFRRRGRPHATARVAVTAMTPEVRAVLMQAQGSGRPIACFTGPGPVPPGIAMHHAYAVLGYDPDCDIVHIWNPWGNHFRPAGPPGLENGFPVQEGRFSVPMVEFVRIFAGIAGESHRPAAATAIRLGSTDGP